MLNRLGVQNVDVVDNGRQAVDHEAAKPYDVVFMDMQMPVMGGVEACKLIHQRSEAGSHPRAAVIFVTAHAATAFESECVEAGGAGFVAKPCNIGDIEKCLQRLYLSNQEGFLSSSLFLDGETNDGGS